MSRIVLALALGILAPAVAAAQPRTGRGAATAGASAYRAAVNNGMHLAVTQDYDGALTALRQAVSLDAQNPEPHVYIGEVLRMQNNMEQAIDAFRTAAQIAQSAGTTADRWRGRALFNIAACLEVTGELEQARAGWVEYNAFASSHGSVTFGASGRARLQALDARIEQERVYVDVRARIAERQRIQEEQAGDQH